MEKDTVVISLKEYNALRDFKINTQKGLTCITKFYGFSNPQRYPVSEEVYVEETKVTEILLRKIKELEAVRDKGIKDNIETKAKLYTLDNKISDLEFTNKYANRDLEVYKSLVNIALTHISNMGIIQFYRWKQYRMDIDTFINSFKTKSK